MAKTYVGNGKKKSADWFKLNVDVDKLLEHAYTGNNGKKYVNLDVNLKAAPDQYGKDISVAVDPWRPDGQRSGAAAPVAAPSAAAAPSSPAFDGISDDLPF